MENTYLIDTNVILDYMSNTLPENSALKLEEIINSEFYISVINKIELLGFQRIAPTHEKQIKQFVSFSKVVYLDDEVVEETIALRKKFNIKLPDAIIAASARAVNATLITRNTKDFRKVSNIKLLNLFDPGE